MRSFSPSQNVRAACSCHARLAESRVAGGREGGWGVCRREHSIVALPVGQGRLGRSLLTTSASLATPTCRGGGEETERWWRWGAEKEAQVVVDGSGRGAAAAATSSGRRMLLRSNSAHARRC
jgi:hypothetical protein